MKPICVPCRRFYKCEKNETQWEEGKPNSEAGGMGLRPKREDFEAFNDSDKYYTEAMERWESHWGPYKLWTSDKWKCYGCGHEILIGVPRSPWAEHFEPDYAQQVEAADVLIRVNDC